MEFYNDYKDKSTDELATTIISLFHEEWGNKEEIIFPDYYADIFLLKFDYKRVWWNDIEADVCMENEIYTETINEWSSISRGLFMPKNIIELWKGEKGPIEISFNYQDRNYLITPKYCDDYIDLEILFQINKIVNKSNLRFELYDPFDQTAFIVGLSEIEKNKLQQERKWKFAY